MGRCVRRAFLCGDDDRTGRNFDHRKALILRRLKLLTEIFAIDLCAYAVMSNHYHLVLRLSPERAAAWTQRDVAGRWARLYGGPPCLAKYLDDQPLSSAEEILLTEQCGKWRLRLADLSWFMRSLNEFVARQANAEDQYTGHFWEGRFKSQALLDEAALFTAMAYVDLNPVRAGLAESIVDSNFTSVQQRLFELARIEGQASDSDLPPLLEFAQSIRAGVLDGLPFNLQDYLDLVDTTGRLAHPSKHGLIREQVPRLLDLLRIDTGEWLATVSQLHSRFMLFIGSPRRLRQCAESRGWRWVKGQAAARRLYAR
jgi:REP element-mobilizing transposase RayT